MSHFFGMIKGWIDYEGDYNKLNVTKCNPEFYNGKEGSITCSHCKEFTFFVDDDREFVFMDCPGCRRRVSPCKLCTESKTCQNRKEESKCKAVIADAKITQKEVPLDANLV